MDAYGSKVRQLFGDLGGEYDEYSRTGWGTVAGQRVIVRFMMRGLIGGKWIEAAAPLLPSPLQLEVRLRGQSAPTLPVVDLEVAGRSFSDRFVASGSPPPLIHAMLADAALRARMVATHELYEIRTTDGGLHLVCGDWDLENARVLAEIGAALALAHNNALQAQGPYR